LSKVESLIGVYATSEYSSWVIFSLLAAKETRETVVGLLKHHMELLESKKGENSGSAIILQYLKKPSEEIFEKKIRPTKETKQEEKQAVKKPSPKKAKEAVVAATATATATAADDDEDKPQKKSKKEKEAAKRVPKVGKGGKKKSPSKEN